MKDEWLSHKIQGTPWSSANSCGWFSTDMSVLQRMNSLLFLMNDSMQVLLDPEMLDSPSVKVVFVKG